VKKERPKGDDGYRTFSVRVKNETVEKLDAIAKKSGYTRNALIGGFDPAVMASPFISTIVDALSLLIYFRFATWILGV